MRENRFPEIKEWVDTLDNLGTRWEPNNILNQFFRTEKSQRSLGWTIAVYLRDEEDVFMCRLKFHNLIESVEEAVLISEL